METSVSYQTKTVRDVEVFYRESGPSDAPPQQVTCSEIQLDLILDYRTNPELHPAFQRYFREKQSPFLAAWGKNDPFFLLAGAEAYKRDLPKGECISLTPTTSRLRLTRTRLAG